MRGLAARPGFPVLVASLVLALLVAVVSTGVLSSYAASRVPVPVTSLAPGEGQADLLGPWQARGYTVADGSGPAGLLVVATGVVAACGSGTPTVFARMAWPPGTEVLTGRGSFADALADTPAPGEVRFMRDSKESTAPVAEPSNLDVALPRSVRKTWFALAGNRARLDVEHSRLYVTRPDGHTERWARLTGGLGC